MRKQLWSVVEQIGAPSWFITVSPPEHKSPICLYYADTRTTIELGTRSKDDVRRLIAKNATAGARYFHYIVSLLIDFVLGQAFDDKTGLFGPMDAYYGTVEQQGRLTLHIHMLVYVKNALTPEQVRQKLVSKEANFEERLIQYLESCHTGDYMPTDRATDDAEENPRDHEINLGDCLPDAIPPECERSCGECSSCIKHRQWWDNFPNRVNELVRQKNRHVCSAASCKKTLSTECKARFPRETVEATTVDDSGYIKLKKTEEWINTFNEVLTYLARCNTDVTSLLTGTAVKAIIAYVTDYISKCELRTSTLHECLKLVLDRYYNAEDEVHGTPEQSARGLLRQMLVQLTSKQEIGAPLAAMYLLGNPDHYTNIDFVQLHWHQYVQFIRSNEEIGSSGTEVGSTERVETYMGQNVRLERQGDKIVPYHATDDYIHRPLELEGVSLYNCHDRSALAVRR